MEVKVKIGIAEDHPLLRLGLVSALAPFKHISVLFDVSNGKELLDSLRSCKDLPDIVLLDIEMPVMRAQDVLGRVRNKYPSIKVIIVSAFFQRNYIQECFSLGVKAFLRKGDPVEYVIQAIQSVHSQGIFLDTEVAKILAEDYERKSGTNEAGLLSKKELAVLQLICEGKSRKVTAESLNVTLDTVAFHMRNIFRKTKTENVKALIAYCIKSNLILDQGV